MDPRVILPDDPPDDRPLGQPRELSEFRRTGRCPVVHLGDGQPVRLISRYDDVRRVLQDRRLSADVRMEGYPVHGVPGRDLEQFAEMFIRMDGTEHMELRRLVTREFMPKKIDEYAPVVSQIVDEQLSEMEAVGPPLDLVEILTLAVPSRVISYMLGVPHEDHDVYQRCAQTVSRRSEAPSAMSDVLDELHDYMLSLVEAKRTDPQDDIISRLVHESSATAQQIASIAVLLVMAGHDTTSGALSLSVVTLLEAPDQLEVLRQRPDQWVNAVEELLRLHSVVRTGPRRVALEDIEVDGETIREGEGIIALVWSANHDETVFPDPEAFDSTRDSAQKHLAFGFGTHQCLGQHLARFEMNLLLPKLFDRFPSLRLQLPIDQLPFRRDMAVYGLHALPVLW